MNMSSLDPVGLAVMLAALSLLPMVFICTTCFLKISVVMVIVRNAIGIQQVPPSIAVYSIALAATAFVMAPVFLEMQRNVPPGSFENRSTKALNIDDITHIAEPLRMFMVRHTAPERLDQFYGIATRQWPPELAAETAKENYVIVIPTFVLSELQQAFEIGFILYVPFVVIDLLISNLLLALGMQMVSPMVLSLPLKMLLFVVLDGWTKLFEGLVNSYA